MPGPPAVHNANEQDDGNQDPKHYGDGPVGGARWGKTNPMMPLGKQKQNERTHARRHTYGCRSKKVSTPRSLVGLPPSIATGSACAVAARDALSPIPFTSTAQCSMTAASAGDRRGRHGGAMPTTTNEHPEMPVMRLLHGLVSPAPSGIKSDLCI